MFLKYSMLFPPEGTNIDTLSLLDALPIFGEICNAVYSSLLAVCSDRNLRDLLDALDVLNLRDVLGVLTLHDGIDLPISRYVLDVLIACDLRVLPHVRPSYDMGALRDVLVVHMLRDVFTLCTLRTLGECRAPPTISCVILSEEHVPEICNVVPSRWDEH